MLTAQCGRLVEQVRAGWQPSGVKHLAMPSNGGRARVERASCPDDTARSTTASRFAEPVAQGRRFGCGRESCGWWFRKQPGDDNEQDDDN
jgi:hypothetical protein